jgi:hypothetical protein
MNREGWRCLQPCRRHAVLAQPLVQHEDLHLATTVHHMEMVLRDGDYCEARACCPAHKHVQGLWAVGGVLGRRHCVCRGVRVHTYVYVNVNVHVYVYVYVYV